MISSSLNKKPFSFGLNGHIRPTAIPSSTLQQKSLKTFLFKDSNINKTKDIKQSNPQKRKHLPIIVNDENCSYNANIQQLNQLENQGNHRIQSQNLVKFESKPTSQNLDTLNCSEKISNQKNQVINLKKKIKKVDHSKISYNFFRQKVSFKKKIYKFKEANIGQQIECKEKKQDEHRDYKIQVEQTTQTFYVFRDSEVFQSLRAKELKGKIVTQRMDNDSETDDEQVEKFVKRMSSEFVSYIEKINKQSSEQLEQNKSLESKQ